MAWALGLAAWGVLSVLVALGLGAAIRLRGRHGPHPPLRAVKEKFPLG